MTFQDQLCLHFCLYKAGITIFSFFHSLASMVKTRIGKYKKKKKVFLSYFLKKKKKCYTVYMSNSRRKRAWFLITLYPIWSPGKSMGNPPLTSMGVGSVP